MFHSLVESSPFLRNGFLASIKPVDMVQSSPTCAGAQAKTKLLEFPNRRPLVAKKRLQLATPIVALAFATFDL